MNSSGYVQNPVRKTPPGFGMHWILLVWGDGRRGAARALSAAANTPSPVAESPWLSAWLWASRGRGSGSANTWPAATFRIGRIRQNLAGWIGRIRQNLACREFFKIVRAVFKIPRKHNFENTISLYFTMKWCFQNCARSILKTLRAGF